MFIIKKDKLALALSSKIKTYWQRLIRQFCLTFPFFISLLLNPDLGRRYEDDHHIQTIRLPNHMEAEGVTLVKSKCLIKP